MRPLLVVLACASIALSNAIVPQTARAATTYVVNTNDDADDGACGPMHCSLREAIKAANASTGIDTIAFALLAARTISPTTELPTISDPVVIDGTTQPGFAGTPIVRIDGSLAPGNVDGLRVTAGSSTIRGLVITGFDDLATDPFIKFSSAIRLVTGGGNVVEGNYIGIDEGAAVSRNLVGITIEGSSGNRIGGTTPTARNVISGNGEGINIDATSPGNLIKGNYIGVDANGSAPPPPCSNCNSPFGNFYGAVVIASASNTLGGTTAGARNVIGNSVMSGAVQILGPTASGNVVQGNFIGTDATGTKAMINLHSNTGLAGGIVVAGASGTLIGGTAPGAGNLISGNGSGGIGIVSICGGGGGVFTCDHATGNVVQGNLIGTDVTGTKALPNTPFDAGNGWGILLGGTANVVGGTTAAARNVISGNTGPGVQLVDAITAVVGNTVVGNYIGTDITGTKALGNGSGILAVGRRHTIGGTAAGARNVIAGNSGPGIAIDGSSRSQPTGNIRVLGNYIGTDATGTLALGNSGPGVLIQTALDNEIGGVAAGAGNVIANGEGDGVVVHPHSTGNSIRGNSIFANSDLGIDLTDCCFDGDGVTPNDPGDADGNPAGNELQNFPVLIEATSGAGGTTVRGTLNSKPLATYGVDIYASASCDASGHGEGERFLGTTIVTTDAAGNATFTIVVQSAPPGQSATATASDAVGNTSEFSACRAVQSAADAIDDVIAQVPSTGLNQGGQNSLTSKLHAASKSLANGNTTAACNQLSAFIIEVQAKQNNGSLAPGIAAALITAADDLRKAIGCP